MHLSAERSDAADGAPRPFSRRLFGFGFILGLLVAATGSGSQGQHSENALSVSTDTVVTLSHAAQTTVRNCARSLLHTLLGILVVRGVAFCAARRLFSSPLL
jgi:hypothetical protein